MKTATPTPILRLALVLALVLVLVLLLALPLMLPFGLGSGHAWAGVPNERAVPAYAEEQTLLQLQQGRVEPGLWDPASGIEHHDRHTLMPPGRQGEFGVFLQRGGNTWRTVRNGPLAVTVASLLLLAGIGVLAHVAWGRRHEPPPDPQRERPVTRFTRGQRWVHWSTAIAFLLLALSGLTLLFGKLLLLPWMGHDVFAAVALGMKWVHNIVGPLFVLLTIVLFLTFVRFNRIERADADWLRGLAGTADGHPVAAPYFNAGEKLWFWGSVVLLGLAMAVTGLVMSFPYAGEVGAVSAFTRYQLQGANVLHLLGAALYMTFAVGHIYMGTRGTPGAWHAMAHGTVSERWARYHHRLWYDELSQRRADP